MLGPSSHGWKLERALVVISFYLSMQLRGSTVEPGDDGLAVRRHLPYFGFKRDASKH
jgi:hypothetical protein